MRDGVHRALLVRQLAAVPERELERQDADDPVDQPARDEARAREVLEGGGLDEAAVRPTVPRRSAGVELGLMRHLAGTQTVIAPASTLTLNSLTFMRSPPSSS